MGFLTNKTAIITGAGKAVLSDGSCGSIGYGIATAYAKEGANLVITGRNMQKLEDAKADLERDYGIKVLIVQADVSDTSDNEAVVQKVVDQTMDTFGDIHVLMPRHPPQALRWLTTRPSSLTSPFIPAYMPHFII
jgi:NAD(P)-dependent dehydrogenase (short-subunit alcohol dehydrogenase family)